LFEERQVRALHRELQGVLGYYSRQTGPVVLAPLFTDNPDSAATLQHEHTHEWLTVNTPFGLFYQALDARSKDDSLFREALDLCLEAQWGVQEATATYIEMLQFVSQPDALDRAVSLLPTEALGGPPYREWFDRIDRVFPLREIGGQNLGQTYSLLVYSIGAYAMNGDVLQRFRTPESLSIALLREYLQNEAPNVRLQDALDKIVGDSRLRERMIELTRTQVDVLVSVVIKTLEAALPQRQCAHLPWLVQTEHFSSSWGLVKARSDQVPLARIAYPEDWAEQASFPDEPLTGSRLHKWLQNASTGKVGLLITISMFALEEIHVAASPYPLESTNEETWNRMLQMIDQGTPAAEGVFSTAELRSILQRAKGVPVARDFIRQSWRPWDRVAPKNWELNVTSEASLEVELSEENFRRLLQFRDLYQHGVYRLIEVYGQQSAAVIFDPEHPGVYALQSVQGEGALMVFNTLVDRLGVKRFNSPINELPDWPLIRFRAQGLLPL
jgi:hypothetical protein